MPSFRGSSQPRDQTQVSCTAGRFSTTRATWEAPFSIVTISSYTPANHVHGFFFFLHILADTCFILTFNNGCSFF